METLHAQKASEEKFKGFCLKVWDMGINLSKQPSSTKVCSASFVFNLDNNARSDYQ